MPKYVAILLIFLVIPSCISEHSKSFQLKRPMSSSARRITKSYLNYLEAISNSGTPLLSYPDNTDEKSKSIIALSVRADRDLLYYPATLWQLYALEGGSQWKNLAESFNEIVHKSQIACEPGNGEFIQNAILTPYLITGDPMYGKVLIECLNQQIGSTGTVIDPVHNFERGTEFGIEKLLENELLFFATRETGDPTYRKLALYQTEQIYDLHFQNNPSNELFFGLANRNENPGVEELEELGSIDFYRLSMSFYGFTLLANEMGDERYGALSESLAKLFRHIYEKDALQVRDNLDLTSRIFVCLAISGLPKGTKEIYKETLNKIFKTISSDMELWPDPEDQEYSFRMYYYLFKCINQGN